MICELLSAFLYTHPRARRVWLMFQILWGTSLMAVLTAPKASADTIAGGLSFTGLHDSYGLPIGSLFISVLPMDEVLGAQGPQFGMSPETWMPALLSAMGTALTYTQLAGWLGLECAFFLCMCAIGIWLIKFALGAIWLGWLAAVAEPIVANIQSVVARLHLVFGGIIVTSIVGGIVCLTIGYATGMGIIAGGLVVALLIWLLLRDPVSELVSDNGVLGIGRSLGFTVSQGVVHNGPIAAGGTSAQLDTLTSWLCDVLVRDIIQLISFGKVVDDVPGCADVFNRAILSGITSAPAQAMKTCDRDAYLHSQQLSAVTVGLFFVVIVLVGIVLLALDYIGCEAFRIGFKAFWDVLLIVPAAAAAMFPGPTRSFAKKAAMRMLVHGAEMIAATAGLGILVLLMAQATRGTLPGAIGMTSPLAKLLVMMLISVFGAIGFRHLMRVFGDAGIPGPIRAGRFALNTAFRTGRTLEGIDYTGRKIKDVRSRLRNRNANKESGQGQTEKGSAGQKAPGRKAHPPPTSTRPPSGPTGSTPTRPGPAGPGRGPGGATGSAPGRTPAPPPPTGASAAAAGSRGAAAAGAARGAATVVAPEVALPVAAGAAAAARVGGAIRGHSSHSSGGTPSAPGRSAPRPPAPPPPAAPGPQNRSPRTAQAEPDDGAPRRSPPPGRTPPRPDN